MPIEMPKGLPFSVDTWSISSSQKRHHFLTHAHMDHLQGIAARASHPIYSTLLTRNLLLQFFPQIDQSVFVCVEVGESLVVEDRDGDFVVTAFDANHCPGAVMFLFEGEFGNMLHTGDCRLTPDCLQSLPCKYLGRKGMPPECQLDCIFLDCTFGRFHFDMPSRPMAVQQVINCIWDHPNASVVYLACDLLGQENILIEVSRVFGEKIFVDKTKNWKCFNTLKLIAPEILSDDTSSRFQLLGFPRMYETAQEKIVEARTNLHPEPLIIRPSSQWYAWDEGISDTMKQQKERIDRAVRDLCGVWHVCYSIHSSRDELEWALELLAPKWVISTTPPCRAMDLEYVKKHCFGNRQVLNACVMRLLDIHGVASLDSDDSSEVSACSVESMGETADNFIGTQCEPVVIIPTHCKKRLSLSPPGRRRPMVTLFGRARLGVHDLQLGEDKQHTSASMSFERATGDVILGKEVLAELKQVGVLDLQLEQGKQQTSACVSFNGVILGKNVVTEMEFGGHLEEKECASGGVECSSSLAPIETVSEKKCVPDSSVSVSSSYSESMRKLYRSLNAPVPQRLPSLVKLMSGIKARRRL